MSAYNAPRVGDVIHYRGERYGIAKAIEGNLCWTLKDGEAQAQPFIWRFKDELNNLHDWPNKNAPPEVARFDRDTFADDLDNTPAPSATEPS